MPFAQEVETGGIQFVTAPPGRENIPYGRFIDMAEFLDPSLPGHEKFAQEVMQHHLLHFLKVAWISDGADGAAWLAVGRTCDDFGRADMALLNALVPHIEISLRNFAALDRERSRSGVAGEAVRRLNFCWLKLDAQGRILDRDPNADAVLDASPIFKRSADGRLALGDAVTDRNMRAAIAALVGQSNGRARAIRLGEQPWLDMLLMRAPDDSLIDAMEPRIIAYIHGDAWDRGDRCEQMSDLFGLTPKESLLAIALSRGLSIREAASGLGLTESSAREYSKRIYAKTGTRGQADLVRLILTSVAMLA